MGEDAERMVVPAPEITFQLLDGPHAAGHAAEVRALHAEVYAGSADGRPGAAGRLAGDFAVQCRQPGYVLAEARSGGYLVGCAAGMPLRPSTSWWRDLTTPLPEQVTAEHAGRTFALIELSVRASWRRQGIGRSLHDLILAGRPEERATLVVSPTATAAQTAFQNWGWRKIGRARNPGSDSPASDVLVTELGADRRR
jgi:ribosomal protein S18 acetylase RimI-like enzyme